MQNIFMRIVNSSLYEMMDRAVFIYHSKKEIYENAACSSENQVKRSLVGWAIWWLFLKLNAPKQT